MRPEEMSRVDPRQRQDGQDESVEKGYRSEGILVRTVVVPLLGFAWGVMAGLVLSEAVGIVGFLLFDRAVGIRFLPIISRSSPRTSWTRGSGAQIDIAITPSKDGTSL
jgi:hypothetical protein